MSTETVGAAAATASAPAAAPAAAQQEEEVDAATKARLARLARKAESARLARARHKQYVQDKQAEVVGLQREEENLLADEEPASAAALTSVRQELRQALSEDQLQVHALPDRPPRRYLPCFFRHFPDP